MNNKNKSNKENKVNKANNIKANNLLVSGFKYLVVGYLITIVMIVSYSGLITYTQMTDKYIIFAVLMTTIMSTTFIGYKFAKKAENRGLIWGILGGLIYGIIFILLGYLSQDQYIISNRSVFVMAFSLIAGGIGGIVGINSKK